METTAATAANTSERRRRAAPGRPLGIVLAAFAASRIAYWLLGLRFDVGFTGASMQVADYDLLARSPWSTAWYLHVQPPAFNLLIGLGADLFGRRAGLGFQAVYLVATVGMLVAFVRLCLDLGIRSGIATGLGVALAVSPTIAQYEHLLFYTHLELVLLVLAARGLQRWCLDRAVTGIVGFSAALCLLALGRSLYHPLWFAGLALVLLVVAGRSPRRRAIGYAVALPLLCGLLVGAKNQAVFGWWTTSSLEGINLHRITEPYLTDEERDRLVRDGVITSVSTDAFTCRDAPGRFPPSGPDHPVPVLDRRWRAADPKVNNLNHRADIACLRTLRAESAQVLREEPDAYLRGVARAVPIAFTSAVPDARVRPGNQDALRGPGRAEALLLGATESARSPFDPDVGRFDPDRTQWVLVLAALCVPAYLAAVLVSRRRRGSRSDDGPVLGFLLYVALTGVVLTQLTEVGENNRLVLVAWPALLAGAGMAATAATAALRRPRLGVRRGGGATIAAAMGQSIVVNEKPSSNPGVIRFETNRALTGMDHERYLAGQDIWGERPPDELARRLLAKPSVAGVQINGNMVTVDLNKGFDSDGLLEVIENLYRFYPDAPEGDAEAPAGEELSDTDAAPESQADPEPAAPVEEPAAAVAEEAPATEAEAAEAATDESPEAPAAEAAAPEAPADEAPAAADATPEG